MTQNTMFTIEEFKKLKPSSKGVKQKRPEEKIQLRVCDFLRVRYPNVIFSCDLASGMRMPMWLAARNAKMRSSRGQPDLFIAFPKDERLYPAHHNGKIYHGLFIELKTEDCRLKGGGITKTKHHQEQAEILKKLGQLGYATHFACGYSEAIDIITTYMGDAM